MSATIDPESCRSILVTGASGQVGWELVRRAALQGLQVDGVPHQTLDITDAASVHETVIRSRPAVVINAAAYTAVDKAETEPQAAYAVNREGVENIVLACADVGVPLIHISTDYVFSGDKGAPYCEDDPVSPVNVYGASKAAGEQLVRQHLPRHIILRTSWVYGVHGHNFVKAILKAAHERTELRVVADQKGCPTAAEDIADTLLDLVARIVESRDGLQWGTYHYAGSGVTTWHGLAEVIIEYACADLGREIAVIPITTAEYPTMARRPLNSVLDCHRIESTFGISLKPWRESLKKVVMALRNP